MGPPGLDPLGDHYHNIFPSIHNAPSITVPAYAHWRSPKPRVQSLVFRGDYDSNSTNVERQSDFDRLVDECSDVESAEVVESAEETVDQVSDKLVEATPIAVTALETSIDCQVDERYDVVPSADDTVDQVSDKLFEVTPVAITALETSVQEELDVDKGKSYISSGDQIDGTTLLTNVAVNMKPELDAVAQAAEDYYLTPTTPDKESIGVPSPITDTADKEMEADFHDVGSFKSEKTAAQISIDYITAEPAIDFENQQPQINVQVPVKMIAQNNDDSMSDVSDASDLGDIDENPIEAAGPFHAQTHASIHSIETPVVDFAVQDDAMSEASDVSDASSFDLECDDEIKVPNSNVSQTYSHEEEMETIVASEGTPQEMEAESPSPPPLTLAERMKMIDLKERATNIPEDDNSTDWIDTNIQHHRHSFTRRRTRFRRPIAKTVAGKRCDKLVTRVTQLEKLLAESQTKISTLTVNNEDVTTQLFNVMSVLESNQKTIEELESRSSTIFLMEQNLGVMHKTMVSLHETVKDVDFRSRADRDIITDLEKSKFDEKIRETNWKVDRMVKVLFEMSAGDVIIDDKDLECGYQGDFVVKMNAWTSANESGVIGCAPLDGSTVMVESFTQTTELDNSSALASSKILDSGEIPAVCSPTTATLNKDASILDSNMGCTHIDSSASDNSSALLTSQEACEDPALTSLPINNKRSVSLSESQLHSKMASSADLTGSTNARSSSMSPPSTTCRIPRCSPTNVTSAASTNNHLSSKSSAQTTSKLPSIRGISAKTKQTSKTHTACSTKSSPIIPRAAPPASVRPAKPSKVTAKPTPRWR